MSDTEARYGWGTGFPEFRDTPSRAIRRRLQDFLHDASPEQVRAWDASIPQLQREVGEVLDHDEEARRYTAILEYELPMESRRPDVIMLVRGAVVVLELKGKQTPSQADIDQAAGYARDLRCYHRDCADRPVVGVLVPTLARGNLGERCGVHILGPDALDEFIEQLSKESAESPVPAEQFLAEEAYRPLPTLVKAARELFHRGDLTPIQRARAFTDPAVNEIARIIHEAAKTHSHHLGPRHRSAGCRQDVGWPQSRPCTLHRRLSSAASGRDAHGSGGLSLGESPTSRRSSVRVEGCWRGWEDVRERRPGLREALLRHAQSDPA